jgi:hypothetical protein
MSTDPIVDELDRQRAEKMAQLNFDFEAFYQDLKEQEKLLPQAVQPPPETPRSPRLHRTGAPPSATAHDYRRP